MAFEYKVVNFQRYLSDTIDDYNLEGLEDWELIHVYNNFGYFKRAIGETQYGNAAAFSSFGEPFSVEPTPVIQLDAVYNLDPKDYETFSASSGTYETSGSTYIVHTGTSVGGYGVIRSRKLIRYRAGQGALARFTAGFSTPHANTIQRAGLIAQEQSIAIGYQGEEFGIIHQNGGKAHIYELKITTAAGGTETAAIQLNGTTYNIGLVAGNQSSVAAQIYASSSAFLGAYTLEAVSSSVFLSSNALGLKSGANSFTSNTAVGNVSTYQTGSADNILFTSQSNFNIDTLDGSGPSRVTVDPSKLNVYQIQYRWLGAGERRYAIENPDNGSMIFFHHEHYSNRYTVPHTDNPSFKIGYVAANVTASPASDVHVYGSSMLGAIEGKVEVTNFPTAVSSTSATLSSNTIHQVLSIKNKLVYGNKINLRVLRLKQTGISFSGQALAQLLIYLNPTTTGGNVIYNPIGLYNSSVYSTTSVDILSTNVPLAAFPIESGGNIVIDLDTLSIIVPPNNSIGIGLLSTGQITSATVTTTFIEY